MIRNFIQAKAFGKVFVNKDDGLCVFKIGEKEGLKSPSEMSILNSAGDSIVKPNQMIFGNYDQTMLFSNLD